MSIMDLQSSEIYKTFWILILFSKEISFFFLKIN